jgi:hypothetical protein
MDILTSIRSYVRDIYDRQYSSCPLDERSPLRQQLTPWNIDCFLQKYFYEPFGVTYHRPRFVLYSIRSLCVYRRFRLMLRDVTLLYIGCTRSGQGRKGHGGALALLTMLYDVTVRYARRGTVDMTRSLLTREKAQWFTSGLQPFTMSTTAAVAAPSAKGDASPLEPQRGETLPSVAASSSSPTASSSSSLSVTHTICV